MKVGLISCAHMHGFSYASHLRRIPGVELSTIWDEDVTRREQARTKFKIPTVSDDVVSLVGSDVDAVVICSENIRHVEHAVAAAEAGKHVLCEKPLATTRADAARMVAAARDHGVLLMTAFPCRFHPAALRTHTAVRAGDVGDVLSVNGTNHGKNPGGWFVDPARSGGGAITDHTVHVVDLLRWMTGQEVTSVFAEETNFDSSLPCEDGAILSLEFENFFATLDTSWSRPPSNPVWGDVTLEVIGAEGVLSLDLFAQDCTVVREDGPRISYENWGDDMDGGLVHEFVAAVREGRTPSVTGVDGLRAVEVVEAAYRSIDSRRPEPVERTPQ